MDRRPNSDHFDPHYIISRLYNHSDSTTVIFPVESSNLFQSTLLLIFRLILQSSLDVSILVRSNIGFVNFTN